MTFISIIEVCVIIMVIVAVIVRLQLIKKKNKLLNEIECYKTYDGLNNAESNGSIDSNNDSAIIDIEDDLEHHFKNTIISSLSADDFIHHYDEIYYKSCSLRKKLKFFIIKTPAIVSNIIFDYERIKPLVSSHNKNVKRYLLETHKNFFDHCMEYPLDKQQRQAVISEEYNSLVVSSAGSGKTSSIVGKVKYLVEIKHIAPQKILLISYTNKAAAELTERMVIPGIHGCTFHKLAIDIIRNYTGVKPSICDNTDVLLKNIYRKFLEQQSFVKKNLEYHIDFADKIDNNNEEQSEYQQNEIIVPYPDMNGNEIKVKSVQESKICSALFSLGVKFKYEEPYEYNVADENHSQYKPDFSIYYEKDGKENRIYLEHYGIDEHSRVPLWFAKDRNIPYEEANQKYNNSIVWKRFIHSKYGTKLLTTSSGDFHYCDIKEKLKALLEKEGVAIKERTYKELHDLLIPAGSRREKSFIRFIVTFITLLKSNCKSIDEVLSQVIALEDERGEFIIRFIIKPIYERYTAVLKANNQLDFTDLILQATKICCVNHPVKYDYIIVDEFQDLSIDRYNFLKALRESNPPAKLFCVGDDWQSIYRFSGSDMALFSRFSDYFGPTEINKIETTYRFGEPLITTSSQFIQRNRLQIKKNIRPFNLQTQTSLEFYAYDKYNYISTLRNIIAQIPTDKSIYLLGRYSFDDRSLSDVFVSTMRRNKLIYYIDNREMEFLTVHKSKGLEADYVILLQCNNDVYGFPSQMADEPLLDYLLTENDPFPYGEERRLFYVAITRAKIKTFVLYNNNHPSVFVDEILKKNQENGRKHELHPNANKKWTKKSEILIMNLYKEGRSIDYIAKKMGRSKTSIIMRLKKLDIL